MPDGIAVVQVPKKDLTAAAAKEMGLLQIGDDWFTAEVVAKYIFRLISSESIDCAVDFFSGYSEDEKSVILLELKGIHAGIAAQYFEPLLEETQSEPVHTHQAEPVHAREAELVGVNN